MEIMMPGCKVPLCENTRAAWPHMCNACMQNTVRRFLHAEGTWEIERQDYPDETAIERAAFWIDYINDNIEGLLEAEQHNINLFGADYDRDEDLSTKKLRLVYE